MIVLLAGINARYAHTNPAIRAIRAYACDPARGDPFRKADIRLYESHVNHPMDRIVRDLAETDADVFGFSCYVWNIEQVLRICDDLHCIRPDATILLGGPQMVGGETDRAFLATHPDIDMMVSGEGEAPFYALLHLFERAGRDLGDGVPGLTWSAGGKLRQNAPGRRLDMADLPFLYADGTDGLENHLLYYEASRGCPLGCSYCLSSADPTVRLRPLDRVISELTCLASAGVQTIKLVDRTFNVDPGRAAAIWRHVASLRTETRFHFEVAAHLLDEEGLLALTGAPDGRFQLEIGIQSIHTDVLLAVNRRADIETTVDRVRGLIAAGNLNVHLDLIAGLPGEGLGRFTQSFDTVFALRPARLQLGILKILPGTPMLAIADRLGYRYSGHPPYRVLSTDALSFEDLSLLEDIGHLVDVYHNSGAFTATMERLTGNVASPFALFLSLSGFWRRFGLFDRNVSRDEAASWLLQYTGLEAGTIRMMRQDFPRLKDEREWAAFLRRWIRPGTGDPL
ncbi:MAG TPA: DUF4080 domain-containing protein [Clostridia bacterium]